jgi:hypothetical protein
VPKVLPELLKDHESAKAQRAMKAMLRMKKIDIGELEGAVHHQGCAMRSSRARDGAAAVLAPRLHSLVKDSLGPL